MQVTPAEPAAPGLAHLATTAFRAAVEAVVPTAGAVAPAADTVAPVVLTVVDVLAVEPDGRVRAAIDGKPELATSAEPLTPGGRYVLRVERGPAGLVLGRPADGPDLPAAVAAAVLRSADPPDLAPAVQAVLGELAALPPTVQTAAAEVRKAIQGFLPENGPPDAAQLRNLVGNGGLHFEAKLGRAAVLASGGREPPVVLNGTGGSRPPLAENRGTERPPPESLAPPDLKGALLRLLQAARDIGEAAPPLAATRAALDGVEANQAANVFAREQGTPYILQVPFPDRDTWRTLHLAVESDRPARDDADGRPNGFRLLMHVPLAGLGETWIDAGLSADRFRAVLYLDAAPARERVRSELPALRGELAAGGFAEVLLDVRPAADLPARRRQLAAAMAAGRPADGSVLDVRA
jgi:hypothetical protein